MYGNLHVNAIYSLLSRIWDERVCKGCGGMEAKSTDLYLSV